MTHPDYQGDFSSVSITPAGEAATLVNDQHFKKLREHLGVPDDFLNTGWNYHDLTSGGGKGGTEMVFIRSEFIVKELSTGDHAMLDKLSASYVEHLLSGKTLLCTILAHFIHKTSGRSFFAMRNETGSGPFQALYDLKGCADDKTLYMDGSSVKPVHKRVWSLRMWCGQCAWSEARKRYFLGKQIAKALRLQIPAKEREEVVGRLRRDVQWLQEKGLMDYSLIVAVKEATPDRAAETRSDLMPMKCRDSSGGECLLYMAIIDFLQMWNFSKTIARGVKVLEQNKATIPPKAYGNRFVKHFEERLQAIDSA